MKHAIELEINDIRYPFDIDHRTSLLSVLRQEAGITGSKEGCDDSECGACMVLLDGKPTNSCSYLAVQADGRRITTVEGLATDDALHPLQEALLNAGGVQCGFCTPGMLISAYALLENKPHPTDEEVRIALAGNLCRCTGYSKIIRAVIEHSNAEAERQSEQEHSGAGQAGWGAAMTDELA